jgi:hypothetical protein
MTAGGSDQQATWSEIEQETNSLVAAADEEGLTLRAVGSTGIRMHCSAAAAAMDGSQRGPKDIDLIALSRQRKKLRRLLEARGYELDRDVLIAMEGARFCCTHTGTGIDLDVFFDSLKFCHKIDLSDRMTRLPTTIPVEDLLLQKLQVHELTDSDILDAGILLAVHEVGEGSSESEQIDAGYVSSLLARDWGFHRTATENLEKIEKAATGGRLAGFDGDALQRLASRAATLRKAIEEAPKSRSWRLRARVGDRMKWWDDVNERELTY